jgi:hypothetical protein
MRKLKLLPSLLLFSVPCFGQAWSGIISPGRAIDWSHSGLPASYPDGETTANPWTPPVRTQCGSTVNASGNASTDVTNVNNALSACTSGHFVALGGTIASPQSFTFNSSVFLTKNGVSLRCLNGPMACTVMLNCGGGSCDISMGSASGGSTCTWSSGLSAGSSSLGFTGCTGAPTVNSLIFLNQCDSGYSGTSCTTGSSTDNGGLYICGDVTACIRGGEGTGEPNHQWQSEWVTGVTSLGGGAYTVTVSSPIRMPNWSTGNTAQASWGNTYYGIGLEDMTIYSDKTLTSQQYILYVNFQYGSWVKGVRFVGAATTGIVNMLSNMHDLIMNNYSVSRVTIDGNYPVGWQEASSSDDLFINNMGTRGVPYEALGRSSGNVFAYNYTRDVFTTGETTNCMDHEAGNSFHLWESNICNAFVEDDTHGTHDLDTWFRNFANGYYSPYQVNPNTQVFDFGEGNRFTNEIAGVYGSANITTYQVQYGSTFGFVYGWDQGSSVINDPLVMTTSMRWGNYDTVTGAIRYCGNSSSPGWSTTCASTSEIPTTLTGNAAFGNNLIPSGTTFPCSFFLAGFTATTCTPFPSGGTGLGWWKVCKTWTTFPTVCASTQTPPLPAIGPDVTGGSAFDAVTSVAGHANDIPATIAFLNLPVDVTYQSSYTITASSWASTNGGQETLTISPTFATVDAVMGPFQTSGLSAACIPSGLNAANEIFMVSSTTSTVTYKLPSNPGVSCTGTFKFPDVRQFDERVYQADGSGGGTIIVSPGSATCPSSNIGVSILCQTFTLSNGSANPATSLSISFGGTNPTEFTQTNNCGTTLAGSGNCTIIAYFVPLTTGSRTAVLNSQGTISGLGTVTATASLNGIGTAAPTAPAVTMFGGH